MEERPGKNDPDAKRDVGAPACAVLADAQDKVMAGPHHAIRTVRKPGTSKLQIPSGL
jgi:hypothetical protein